MSAVLVGTDLRVTRYISEDMLRLLCVALVLICIMGAAVKSQPTIAETDISCSESAFSEMVGLLQQNHHLGQTLESERQLVRKLRKRVATLETTGSC